MFSSSLRNRTFLVVVAVVILAGLLTSGCANTGYAIGGALGHVGDAAKSIGEGTGKLLTGIGEDMKDASSKQLENSKSHRSQHRSQP